MDVGITRKIHKAPVNSALHQHSDRVLQRLDVGAEAFKFVERRGDDDFHQLPEIGLLRGVVEPRKLLQSFSLQERVIRSVIAGMDKDFRNDAVRLPLQEFQVHLVVSQNLVFFLPAANVRQHLRAVHPYAVVLVARV